MAARTSAWLAKTYTMMSSRCACSTQLIAQIHDGTISAYVFFSSLSKCVKAFLETFNSLIFDSSSHRSVLKVFRSFNNEWMDGFHAVRPAGACCAPSFVFALNCAMPVAADFVSIDLSALRNALCAYYWILALVWEAYDEKSSKWESQLMSRVTVSNSLRLVYE